MTIHFHSKHYSEYNFCLHKYMIMLLFEQTKFISASEIGKMFKISERTVYRYRNELVDEGFLTKVSEREFILTDKAYS